MPLVYRAVLEDGDGGISSAVEPLFRDWLLDKGLVRDDFVLTPGLSCALTEAEQPAWLQHQHVPGRRKHDDGLRRLRLVEESAQGRWITSIIWRRSTPLQQELALDVRPPNEQLPLDGSPVAGEGSGAWVWVDLEHEPVGARPLTRPGSPKIIRALMGAGEAYDGTLPLTSEAFTITRGHVEELVGYLQDPQRHVPVVVFAHDAQRAYDQAELARLLARDLAGVAAVFVLADGPTNQALASALPPDYGVFGGALRTYLPGAGTEDDTATRHRVLGRVSLAALGRRAFPALKDQVLQLSTRRSGPVDGFVVRRLSTPLAPGPERRSAPQPPRADGPLKWLAGQVARIRQALGRPDPAEFFSDAGQAQAALGVEIDHLLGGLRRPDEDAAPDADPLIGSRLRAAEARLAAGDAERQDLESLFQTASDEAKLTSESLARLRDDYDYLELELAEHLRDNDKLRRRTQWLRGQIAAAEQAAPTAEDILIVPEAVAEVVQLARDRLSHVVVGPTDADAAELDVHSGASLYAAKAWSALLALEAFASARSSGDFSGSFRQWCSDPAADVAAVSAQTVAMAESEPVDDNPVLRSRRVFPVPREVSESGRQYMPAHIKLVKRGEAAPRLHFFDDSGGKTAKVYVGYIGPHLPTARFD